MKDVIISISSIQKSSPTSTSTRTPIKLVTCGKYSHSDDEVVFTYMESELTGMQGTKTTFRITPNTVVIQREGSTSGNMVFQRGRKHDFIYETEYGPIPMGISTDRLISGMTGSGGDLELGYMLDMDKINVSYNLFTINIKESPSGSTETAPR